MKRIFYSFATLLAVVLLASCSSEKDGTACLKLIPEDAALVMRFDLKAVGEATNYANDKATKDELKKLVSDIPGDKDVKEKIKAIIENPSESGISTEHPVYFYLAPNVSNMIGLVGTTGDKDKFVELLQLIADESNLDDVEEYEGISCLDLGVAAFLVADDWFYVGAGFENLQKGRIQVFQGNYIGVAGKCRQGSYHGEARLQGYDREEGTVPGAPLRSWHRCFLQQG